MHLETLKTFCDLVETSSFSKAARQNLISQSAVSQQVRMLEQRYGVRLIERGHPAGAIPTEAGQIYYTECKELLGRFAALEERLRGVDMGFVADLPPSSGDDSMPPSTARDARPASVSCEPPIWINATSRSGCSPH